MSMDKAIEEAERTIETSVIDLFQRMRERGQEMGPMVHLLVPGDDEPEVIVIGLAGDDKESFMEAIRGVAYQREATWAAFMTEGWMVVNPIDETIRPSHHPRRIECLVLQVEGPLGRRTVIWEIEGKGKHATLGKRTETTNAQGRFVGILPKVEERLN